MQIVAVQDLGEAAAAVMSGNADAVFESYTAMKRPAGGWKPLASTAAEKPTATCPSVPTAARNAGVRGYVVTGWNALAAPAGTPPEAIAAAQPAT